MRYVCALLGEVQYLQSISPNHRTMILVHMSIEDKTL